MRTTFSLRTFTSVRLLRGPCSVTASAVGVLFFTSSLHAQELDSTVKRVLGPTAEAFLSRLEQSRPAAVSAELKGLILDSLPHEGEITELQPSERRKLASLDPVLRVHRRELVYTVKIVDVVQAAVALHARSVVLISRPALRMLDTEELQAQVAHEIGHEYVWTEYQAALDRKDLRLLRQLESFCDGVAIATLQLARLDPSRLSSGLEKVIGFNRRRLGLALNEAHYPPFAERKKFIDAVIAWLGRDAT